MYIATPEQPASYLFITRTSHLNHTRPQNAPHTTHKFRVLLLNARTQPSFDQTDDGVDAETSLSFFLSLSLHVYLSFPPFFLALTIGSINIFWIWDKEEEQRTNRSSICPLLFFLVSYSPFCLSACLLKKYHVFTNNINVHVLLSFFCDLKNGFFFLRNNAQAPSNEIWYKRQPWDLDGD